jgi:antirestriction protein ArdC
MASTRRFSTDHPAPRDNYRELTDRIVTALEARVVPWRREWDPAKAGQNSMPSNATTGRRYRGVNVLMLAMSGHAWSTDDNRWCSYRQAAERGWQVRKGERGTTVFFYKRLERKDCDGVPELTADGSQRVVPMLRASTVFHASQMDGIPGVPRSAPQEVGWTRPEVVDTILRNSGVVVRTGGSQAFYSPSSDHIQLPPHEAFVSPEGWAATALHELAHASGHSSRLDRDLTGRFGTAGYAAEELRAELASCFMGHTLGLPTDIPNHASYIEDWLCKLRNDKREIFRAAAAAQRIADFCLDFHPSYRAEHATEAEAIEGEPDDAAATGRIDPDMHLAA